MYLCLCNVMRSQRHCSLCDCDAGFYPQSQQLCIQHVDTYTFCRTACCFSTNVLNMAHNSCIFSRISCPNAKRNYTVNRSSEAVGAYKKTTGLATTLRR